MANDTKIAALLRPKTQTLHKSLESAIVELLGQPKYEEGLTRLDLANLLYRGVNSVCAPVKALLEAGVVQEHTRIRQPETGNLAWVIRLKGGTE